MKKRKDYTTFLRLKMGTGVGLVDRKQWDTVSQIYSAGCGDKFEKGFSSHVANGLSRFRALEGAIKECQQYLNAS